MQDVLTDADIKALLAIIPSDNTPVNSNQINYAIQHNDNISVRDNEIKYIIQIFQEIWLRYPMLRFQQVIELIKMKANLPDDIFYLPDNELLDILTRLVNSKSLDN